MQRLALVALSLVFSQSAFAGFLPANNLHLQDHPGFVAQVDKTKFNEIIDTVVRHYKPVAALHGATLEPLKRWDDSTVNAYAEQNGNRWILAMFGGLARRQEVSPDGFAMVVCHELGHHLGGYPLKGTTWAASEGQSDYFATHACARKIWTAEVEENARHRATVEPFVKQSCDAAHKETKAQDLCYRISAAGKSLGMLLSALSSSRVPSFQTPDQSEVDFTQESHPEAQCRVDTYFQGGLCAKEFEANIIPGKNNPRGQNSVDAESEANRASCAAASGLITGTRPRCWFKPKIEFPHLKLSEFSWKPSKDNGNTVIEPGESVILDFKLTNDASASTTAVSGKLIASNGIRVEQGESGYNDIAPKAVVESQKPFIVTVGKTVACGSSFDVKLNLQSAFGSAYFKKTLSVGTLVETEVGAVTNPISIPDGSHAGTSSVIRNDNDTTAPTLLFKLKISHPDISQIKAWLTLPDTTLRYLFWQGERKGTNLEETFKIDGRGVKMRGDWKLKIADVTDNLTGSLESWKMALGTPKCE